MKYGTDSPDSDEVKELYAYFGHSFYCANILEFGVVNALCTLDLLEKREDFPDKEVWKNIIDKHYDDSFKNSFGKLLKKIELHRKSIPELESVVSAVTACVDRRNFLAHHFWREHATSLFTKEGRAKMIKELEEASELFFRTDQALEKLIQPIDDRYGITAEARSAEFDRMIQEVMKRNIR